jgi:hypothetical protein
MWCGSLEAVWYESCDNESYALHMYRVLYMRFWGHEIEIQKVDCIDV